jgi:DNA-directed RNA polymerase subunit K/omega
MGARELGQAHTPPLDLDGGTNLLDVALWETEEGTLLVVP